MFSENLKMIMKKKSMTAQFIADRLGVSRGTITNWSNGERFPKDEELILGLAEILQVKTSELFGDLNLSRQNILDSFQLQTIYEDATETSFGKNLRNARKKAGLTQVELAEKLTQYFGKEYTQGNIKSYEASTNPKIEVISAMASILRCKEQDFFSGISNDLIPELQIDNNYIELPTIYAGLGAIGYAVDMPENRVYPKELIPPQITLDENVLVIIVAGNSMEPLYYENDVVFIDMVNGREFTQIDGTYLVKCGNTIQIKDVKFLGNGDIMISSRNDTHTFMVKKDLGIDDWEIVGKPYVNIHATVGSKLKTN